MESFGLIAGNGPLPILFAREARARGYAVVAVGHVGETWKELERQVEHMTWIRVGQLESLIRALRERGVKRAVMLGAIDKRRALQDLRVDERGKRVLSQLSARGDDALLNALASELEAEGIQVVGSRGFIAPYLASRGPLSPRQITAQEEADLRLGIRVLNHLGSLDIGQAVVIKEGVVLAVEAIEGTDRAIVRGGRLGGPGTVVVKGSKPQQDLRFDLPAVGPGTIRAMVSVGAAVLAIEAGRTVVLEREEVLRIAQMEDISLRGWAREDADA